MSGGSPLSIANLLAKYFKITPSGDDEGVRVENGQFSVGKPGAGQESAFGEGDSYPVPIAYHCTISDTTGLTIINAVDVTTIFQSDDGSTAGLFNGVDIGDYILVGSDSKYGGVKAKIETAGADTHDNIVGEFLEDNTPTWTDAPFMVTESTFPYEQKADNIANLSDSSEQWRFGFNPLVLPTPWDLVTININGTDVTKYWARFRITSTITTDPILQQIKLHTSRFEVNEDGVTEYFGRARYPKPLLLHQKLFDTLDGFTPRDSDVALAVGITAQMKSNLFANNFIDGYALIAPLPTGIDTSIPVIIRINFIGKSATAGDVEFTLETAQIKVGDTLDGTKSIDSIQTSVKSIAVDEDDVLKQAIFLADIKHLIPGESLTTKLTRDASGTRVNDTYIGDAVIVSVSAVGYFWRP